MALRTTTTRLLNARLAAASRPSMLVVRAQSTLNTGKVVEDPQIGDYPNLPYNSSQARGPFGWWDPQDKRNFGENVHEEDEIMGVWAPDLHTYSPYKALAQIGVFFASMAAFAGFIYKVNPERPVIQRTYPFGGLTEELGAREADIRPRGARTE
ncbi:hypothetical protein J3Q64DRAFT_1707759 [Phycomyces blakesleeanus]|uniref:Uncharacterized protein n=2 Tax=Phycomyces blakesleeanus TaxID=4837 RepID=A0ABR3BCM1_PHYBL